MEQGGTITWFLTANDADFNAAMRRARGEAKATGDEVDRSLNKGTQGAQQALRNVGSSSNSTAASVRNLKKETNDLGVGSKTTAAGVGTLLPVTSSLASFLGYAAGRSAELKGALDNTDNSTKAIAKSMSSAAAPAKSLAGAITGAGNSVGDSGRKFGQGKLSLDDFYGSLGQAASRFRSFQIALRGFQLTGLIIGVAGAAGAIIELAGALAALGGLLYTVPAGIASLAGIMGTLKIATGGIADSFKALTKQQTGYTAGQALARKQTQLTVAAQKQDASLVKQLTKLNADYSDTLEELAKERLAELNAQILKGAEAWGKITDAANDYLDVSKSLSDLTQAVADAQDAYNTALVTYGPASQQATAALRDLYAAQSKVSQANAELDSQYGSISDNIKDLATNVNSLQAADRNELSATLLNLNALKLDKQARGEATDQVSRMIDVLNGLINIKDTDLTINPDFGAAQKALDNIKAQFPDIAVAAKEAASDTEVSLTKSLKDMQDQMADINQQRIDNQKDLADSLADSADLSGAKTPDPFAGLSQNAKAFVLALKDVQAAFAPVKATIQDNFFAGLDTEIKNVATVTFPILQVGLGAIATSINGFLKETSRVIQEPFFTGFLESSFKNTAGAVDILKGAIEPLLQTFTNLAQIGQPYITMLAQFTTDQLKLAAAYTGSTDGQKSINDAIKTGVGAMKSLGKLVGAAAKLLLDLFNVADSSGFSFIQTLTTIINNMDAFVNSADGQAKLKALFEATQTIALSLADAVGKILYVVLTLIQAYNNLDGPIKDFITNALVFSVILGPIITYVSSLVASFNLIKGLGVEVFQGVTKGAGLVVDGLGLAKTAVSDFSAGFSDVRAAESTFTGVAGTIGGKAREIADNMKTGLDAAINWGKGAATAVANAAKSAAQIAAQGATIAAKWVAGAAQAAAAWVAQFAVMVARGVVTLAVMVGQAVATAAAWVAGAVATAAAWVVANAAILGIFGLIALVVVAAIALIVANWSSIVAFFQGVWDGIVAVFSVVADFFKNIFGLAVAGIKLYWDFMVAYYTAIWNGIVAVFTVVADFFKGVFAAAVQGIQTAWNAVVSFFQGIWNGIVFVFQVAVQFYSNLFKNVYIAIQNAIGGIVDFFKGLWNNIVGAFAGAVDLGKNIITGLVNGLNSAKNFVVDKITEIAKGALNAIKSFFGIHSPSRVMAEVGSYLMEGFGNGIESMGDKVVDTTKNVADGVLGVFDGMSSSINGIGTDFSVNGTSTLNGQFAPSMTDSAGGGGVYGSGGVVINQNNAVYTELDMDQVNRNLTWELNKV